jgi:prephenate dehydratase
MEENNLEYKVKTPECVAIQGIEGSFHHHAARKYFGENSLIQNCHHFRDVVKVVSSTKSHYAGIMAIENSIAGSILPNYQLIQKGELKIAGEVYLHIKHQLLIHPEAELSDIQEVHSHPMAILQCMNHLENFSWKLVESDDTASSARRIIDNNTKHIAAIASRFAADIYGLKIANPDISTVKNNYTRFLVLQKEEYTEFNGSVNKASIHFHTDNSFGILAKILSKISQQGINLSKLQSFPLQGSEFQYAFHVDLEFDILEQFHNAMYELSGLTEGLTIYGIYQKGEWENS